MSGKTSSGDKAAASWHWSSNPRARMEFVENPQENDVLFGRGAPFIRWKGNVRFRRLVNQRKGEYVATRRHAKKNAIAREIIDEIQINRGGRFLIKHEEDGTLESTAVSGVFWVPADRNLVFEKVKQTLRDKQQGTMLLDEESEEASIDKKRKPDELPERTQRASQTSRGVDPSSIDVLDDVHATETSSDLDFKRKSTKPRFELPSSVIPTRSHHDCRESSFNADNIVDNRQHELALFASNHSECEGIHHPSSANQSRYEESEHLQRQLALRRHIEEQQIRADLLESELQRRRLESHRYRFDGLRASPGQEQAMNGAFSGSDTASWSIPGSSRLTDNSAWLQNRVQQILQQQPRMTETPSTLTNANQLGNRFFLNDIRLESSALRWPGNLLQAMPFHLQSQGGEYIPLESMLRQQHIMEAVPNGMSVVQGLSSGFPRNSSGEVSLLSSSRSSKQTGETQPKRPAANESEK